MTQQPTSDHVRTARELLDQWRSGQDRSETAHQRLLVALELIGINRSYALVHLAGNYHHLDAAIDRVDQLVPKAPHTMDYHGDSTETA